MIDPRQFIRPAILLISLMSVTVNAQLAHSEPDASAWVDDGKASPHPRLADIAVPREAGVLTLSALHSFGSARDVDAQYESADHRIEATIYIYENGFPDALLTSIITDRVILARFGPATKAVASKMIAVGAAPNTAYLTNFEGGTAPAQGSFPPAAVFTVGAYLHTNASIVKIRVTGPAERRSDVASASTALISALRFFGTAKPLALPKLELTECPVEPLEPDATARDIRLAAATVIPLGLELTAGEDIPASSGTRRICTMSVEQGSDAASVLLRPAGTDKGERYLLLGDGGTVVVVREMASPGMTAGPFVALHTTGSARLYGPFDHVPSASQLMSLGHGNQGWLGGSIIRVKFDPTGNFAVNYNTDRMIDAVK